MDKNKDKHDARENRFVSKCKKALKKSRDWHEDKREREQDTDDWRYCKVIADKKEQGY